MATTPAIIDAALDCFQQSRDTVLRLTREYTLPKLVLEDKMSIIQQIADASDTTISFMLVDTSTASAILAHIYMQTDSERTKGLTNYLREASKSVLGDKFTLHALLASVRIPLVYRLALLLGDQDVAVATQVRRDLSQTPLRHLLILVHRLNAPFDSSSERVIRPTRRLRSILASS